MALVLLTLTIVGCGTSKSDLEQEVRDSMYEKLNENDPDPAIWVNSLNLVHQGGPDYTGVAVISHDPLGDSSEKESVNVKVTFDGDTFIWKIIK